MRLIARRREVGNGSRKVNPKAALEEHRKSLLDLEDELAGREVPFFEPGKQLDIDADYLSLPPHITEVSARDLGEYLNAYTQQKVYIRTLLGHAELLCEEAKRRYDAAGRELYSRYATTRMSERAKDREVNMDDEVRPLYLEYSDFVRKCRLLELTISNIEDIIFMLSREVSRRGRDFDDENRNYNVNR